MGPVPVICLSIQGILSLFCRFKGNYISQAPLLPSSLTGLASERPDVSLPWGKGEARMIVVIVVTFVAMMLALVGGSQGWPLVRSTNSA